MPNGNGMPWTYFCLDAHLETNPKFLAFCHAAGLPIPTGVYVLYRLWRLARLQFQDGRLHGHTPATLDLVIGVPGVSKHLIATGFICEQSMTEMSGPTLVLHEWMDYNGRFLRDATRKRVYRRKLDKRTRPRTATEPSRDKGARVREEQEQEQEQEQGGKFPPLNPPLPVETCQKGRTTPKEAQPLLPAPAWLDADAWQEWCSYRWGLRRRHPWTERAAQLSLDKLDRLRAAGDDPRRVIEESILNAWRGLFSLNGRTAPSAEDDGEREWAACEREQRERETREAQSKP